MRQKDDDFMAKVAETKGGCYCPTCGQKAKIYKRKLSSEMAYAVLMLHKASLAGDSAAYHHSDEFMRNYKATTKGWYYSLIRFWDLAETSHNDDPAKKDSGMWRLTDKGRLFARGAITVPSHVFIYKAERQRFSDGRVTIRQALGERFHYQELMAERIDG